MFIRGWHLAITIAFLRYFPPALCVLYAIREALLEKFRHTLMKASLNIFLAVSMFFCSSSSFKGLWSKWCKELLSLYKASNALHSKCRFFFQ